MSRHIAWTGSIAAGLAAVLSMGCSGGGGGGGSSRSTASPTTSSTAAIGWVSSAVISTTAGASVSALEPVSSSQVLVATPPDVDVAAVGSAVQVETGFVYSVVSLTTAGTEIYAGTGSAGVAGSGDVYHRGTAGWQLVFDGDREHVVVAALGNDLFAFEAEPGMTPQVSILSAGQWASSTTLLPVDCTPTQALEDGAALWLGASDAAGTGDALLFQGDAAGFTQVALPAGTAGAGEAEHVTGLALDAQGELVIALVTVETASGAVQSGRLLRYTAQQTFDVLLTLNQDAPLSVVAHQGTIYVGTDSGRLLHDDGSAFVEDSSIPQNQGVTRLREATPTTLWVGVRTAQGAALHTLVGSAPPAGTGGGATGGTSYLTHIKPLLSACSGCHATQSNYRLSAGLADDQADYQATQGVIDAQLPDASPILTKTSGALAHGGGAPWPSGSNAYQTVLLWIQQGAPFSGGTAPVSTIPTNPTYVADVKPIMTTCVGCHANEDDMELSPGLTDDTADYMAVLDESNLGDPAASGILRRATQQRGHPVKVFDVGSVPYDTLLRWVQTGAPFN